MKTKNLQSESMFTKKSYTFSEQKHKTTIRRSQTTSGIDCIVVNERGFKPTDRFDAVKKSFLVDLSKKIWTKRVD